MELYRASVTLRRVTSLELVVKDEKGDFVADSHCILARWRNFFSQLLNVDESLMLGDRNAHGRINSV